MHGTRVGSGCEFFDEGEAPDQLAIGREVDLPGIELLEHYGDFDAEADGVEAFAVGDDEAHPFDELAFEVRFGGGKAGGVEADSGDFAGVEGGGQWAALDEFGSDLLKRGVGTAADRVVF